MNPVEVWWQFKNANILPPQRTQTLAFELLTDVIRTVLAKDDDGVIPLGDKLGEERLAIRIEREMMERGNRVFPVSDNANDVAGTLTRLCERAGVEILHAEARDILTG